VILENTTTLDAPRQAVWDLMLDPERFAACMPGVEQVTRVDDHTFSGAIVATVGPMSGTFTFRATIVESMPPAELSATILGSDSVTKSTVTTEVLARLAELSPSQTELAYRARIDIGGRMAILGDMIVRATASLMVEEFLNRVRRQLASA
jgi:carbon monoxide dehydrogenase subunit G